MVAKHTTTRQPQQDQSLPSDANPAAVTPPTDAANSSILDPLNYHVSTRLTPKTLETHWDLLLDTIRKIKSSELHGGEATAALDKWPPVLLSIINDQLTAEKQLAAAAVPLCQPPKFIAPMPPVERRNPMNYRIVWLCPTGKKAHINYQCVKDFRPYAVQVMPGSSSAFNWCLKCSTPPLLEAFNRKFLGCDGHQHVHELGNIWGELE